MARAGSRVRSQWGAMVLLCIAGSACSGEGRASVSSEPPSASPSAPSLTFAFDGETPTVTRQTTGLDELYINPGAVIDDGTTLHMFANVFSEWPGHMDVPHLTSADGISWTLDPVEPVLTSEDVAYADPGMDVSTGFLADDGTWVLLFETVSVSDPWSIGRATATSPAGPWTVDPEPILEAGAEGAFDAGGVAWPSVVRLSDGYALYYTAFDRPRAGTGVIAMATSPDGVVWTKRAAPVIVADQDWEHLKLDRPRVTTTPGGLAMVYAGGVLTDRGLAWSEDGVTWTKAPDQPAISRATFPISGQAWDAALVYRDGLLVYYLEIGGMGGTQIYRATADLP
jgi:Predicted glycosylase